MIEPATLEGFHRWFDGYVWTHRMDEPAHQRNLDIKIEHSLRVCDEILGLGRSVGLDEPGLRFAEAAALFHDIGRFEQYANYRTFQDHLSVNHGAHGVAVLRREGVLEGLEPSSRETLCRVIENHNKLAIPEEDTEACRRMSRLLRDADKLDIFRVVLDHFENGPVHGDGSVVLGLSGVPEISPDVAQDLLSGKPIRMNRLRTVADFMVMQMGWVFDLNTPSAFRAVRERRILERLKNTLPRHPLADRVGDRVREYLADRCAEG